MINSKDPKHHFNVIYLEVLTVVEDSKIEKEIHLVQKHALIIVVNNFVKIFAKVRVVEAIKNVLIAYFGTKVTKLVI